MGPAPPPRRGRSPSAPAAPILQPTLGPAIRAEAELCVCRRRSDGSLTPSSSAASAASYPGRTVHGRALPVSSGQSPMPSIWCDYAAWRANESSCVARHNAPAVTVITRSSGGRFNRCHQASDHARLSRAEDREPAPGTPRPRAGGPSSPSRAATGCARSRRCRRGWRRPESPRDRCFARC